MVSKRKNNKQGIKQRKLIAAIDKYVIFYEQLDDEMSIQLHALMRDNEYSRSPTAGTNCKAHIDTLRKILLDPYTERRFNMCRPLKRAVENWMHDTSGMSIQEIGTFTGPLVEFYKQYDLNASVHPWFPGHGLGFHMWAGIFTLMGALTEDSNDHSDILEKLRDKRGYKNVMLEISENNIAINNAFKIEPGQELTLTGL